MISRARVREQQAEMACAGVKRFVVVRKWERLLKDHLMRS